ncbi:MAG TPA: S53 family peptidase [Acidimicrobiales bacterium]|nr:S53 family peptidase [Acidimicrobiales bacterium]
MRARVILLPGLVAAVTVVALTLTANASPDSAQGPDHVPVCLPSTVPGVAHCNAIQLLNPSVNWHGSPLSTVAPGKSNRGGGGHGPTTTAPPTTVPSAPPGYGPPDLQSAYNLATAINNMSGSRTVAIVDAYNDPYAESDLAAYRTQFGLGSCSTANGCLSIVGQSGSSTSLPRANKSWAEEISLDLDMVSAACPACHILLVEANSASMSNLAAAVQTAASFHPVSISNSYGASEFSGETSYDPYYSYSGIAVTVSAGDSGYGVEYPAASPGVTAVGGTSLVANTSNTSTRAWSETVWSGTGSGCSAYENEPQWQSGALSGGKCTKRTVGDVAAVADPYTGVAVYDSYGQSGWLVFGGTSVASPIIASIYALAGYPSSSSAGTSAEGLYTSTSLNRVTSGTNATNCTAGYLCDAGQSLSNGYNGPTGMGTPNGTNGF